MHTKSENPYKLKLILISVQKQFIPMHSIKSKLTSMRTNSTIPCLSPCIIKWPWDKYIFLQVTEQFYWVLFEWLKHKTSLHSTQASVSHNHDKTCELWSAMANLTICGLYGSWAPHKVRDVGALDSSHSSTNHDSQPLQQLWMIH